MTEVAALIVVGQGLHGSAQRRLEVPHRQQVSGVPRGDQVAGTALIGRQHRHATGERLLHDWQKVSCSPVCTKTSMLA